MVEYIPRNAALIAIYTSTAPALEVKAMPAADVVEVRHGEWKHVVYHNGRTPDEDMICSECGASGLPNWNYCPNCGADLRGYGMEESDAH